jgi:hypothetical protein
MPSHALRVNESQFLFVDLADRGQRQLSDEGHVLRDRDLGDESALDLGSDAQADVVRDSAIPVKFREKSVPRVEVKPARGTRLVEGDLALEVGATGRPGVRLWVPSRDNRPPVDGINGLISVPALAHPAR